VIDKDQLYDIPTDSVVLLYPSNR